MKKLLALAAGILFAGSSASAATIYATELFGISDPNAIGPSTVAMSVNNSNQVVGYYVGPGDGDTAKVGFLYSDGTYTNISFPGAPYTTWVTGINDQGQIIGTYLLNGQTNAFLYSGGDYTTLSLPFPINTPVGYGGLPNGDDVPDFGINDSDEIVGSYADSNGVSHGYVYSLATSTVTELVDISTASQRFGGGTVSTGIDNNGDVVGFYYLPGCCGWNGFVLHDGVYTAIDTGITNSTPLGINDQGEIVGIGGVGPAWGFLDTQFGSTVYNEIIERPANALVSEALAVNDNGDFIAVDGASVAGSDSPEPTPAATLCVAALVLLCRRAVRRPR